MGILTTRLITYCQIDGIREYSMYYLSFMAADRDTDHYLVVAKVRERLVVNKQAAQMFDMDGSNLRKLSKLEVR
jgi:hypothetical protein